MGSILFKQSTMVLAWPKKKQGEWSKKQEGVGRRKEEGKKIKLKIKIIEKDGKGGGALERSSKHQASEPPRIADGNRHRAGSKRRAATLVEADPPGADFAV